MQNKLEIKNFILTKIFETKIEKIVFSDTSLDIKKIILKVIEIKNQRFLQIESFKNNQAFHKNIVFSKEQISYELSSYLDNYSQILIKSFDFEFSIIRKKYKFKIIEKKLSCKKSNLDFSHNNNKNYILQDGVRIDFLQELKIMDSNGQVLKNSYKKFRQINKYLEFIKYVLDELKVKKMLSSNIKIVDFGCGKSYLSFALYYYLNDILKIENFEIIGLDLKKDVIEFCNNLAKKLSYNKITFLNEDIKNFSRFKEVDLVFSLHACNNATDYSILKALELNAKAVMAVPCCQSEFFQKLSKNKKSKIFTELGALSNYGIELDKFSTLLTDSYRASSLEMCGYKTDILEFIDMEHTPKNVLIRGIKTNILPNAKKIENHVKLREFLDIDILLDDLIKKYYKIKL